MQRLGLPDLISCFRGRFLAFEVKVPGEKPTTLQLRTIAEIWAAGGAACAVDNVCDALDLLYALGGNRACACRAP